MSTDPNALPPEAVDALRGGNKIEAIKRVRQAMGLGLAEAKALVEAHEHGITALNTRSAPSATRASPGLSPGQEPRANPWKWVSLVLAIALAALVLVLAR